MTLLVSNAYLAGRSLQQITEFLNRDIVCTRLHHGDEVVTPRRDTVFSVGDQVLWFVQRLTQRPSRHSLVLR